MEGRCSTGQSSQRAVVPMEEEEEEEEEEVFRFLESNKIHTILKLMVTKFTVDI